PPFFLCTAHLHATHHIYTLSYTTLFRSQRKHHNQFTNRRSVYLQPGVGQRLGARDAIRGYAARARLQCAGRGSGRRSHPRECAEDRKSTRLNSSHVSTSYAVFCLKKKKL